MMIIRFYLGIICVKMNLGSKDWTRSILNSLWRLSHPISSLTVIDLSNGRYQEDGCMFTGDIMG